MLELSLKTSSVLQNTEKANYGLSYRLTLTRNNDNAVLKKITLSTMVKVKLMEENGLYHIVHLVFQINLFYLNNF